MGALIGLDGKTVDPVAIAIREALLADGSVSQSLDELPISVNEWRRTARAVARELRRPIQTTVSACEVHAVLRDWPSNERERNIHERLMTETVDAIALKDEMVTPVVVCPGCRGERKWRPADRIDLSGSGGCQYCGLVELQPDPRRGRR